MSGADDLADRLATIVGRANVIAEPNALWTYGYDATMGYRGAPAAVAFPSDEAETAGLIRFAVGRGLPCLPRGGATSLAASAVPPDGALVIDTNRIRVIRSIDPETRRAVVEPGVGTRDFRARVARDELLYPPDPSSEAGSTIGGNLATNAGGPYAYKYGVTRDYVERLRLVTSDGSVADLRRPEDGPPIDVVVGSEGTLGAVTLAELSLIPAPMARELRAAVYPDGLSALRAVPRIIASGLVPAKLEYLDDVTIRALERARPWGLPHDAGSLLLVELDGDRVSVERAAAALDRLLRDATDGARLVESAVASQWWEARGAVTASLARIRPAKIGEDICVPRTSLSGCVDRLKREAAAGGLELAIFGHVADGTIHPNVLYDPGDPGAEAAAREFLGAIASAGLEAGGVLSGEHGLGRAKRPFVDRAYDAPTLGLMRRLKAEFDPDGIFNPGAMWPPL